MKSRLRRGGGKLVTAVFSLVAVAMAAAYLLAPTHTAFAISIRTNSALSVPTNQIVVYGKAIDVHQNPIAGVQVSVNCGSRVILTATSLPDGTFRSTGILRASSSCVVKASKRATKTGSAERRVKLSPRHAYELTVRVIPTGKLILLPVRSY